MKQSYIYISLAVILVLVGLFAFNSWVGRENVPQEPVVTEKPVDERPKTTITAKHQFKDGLHIVAGELNMPTPCHILTWQEQIAESFPEQVTIAFDLSTQADACAQVITPTRFKVEFAASEEASIEATLNGERVILNLIEAGPDEDLDDFELFIKG